MMRDLASYLHNGTSRQVEVRYESASVSPEVALSRFGSTPEEYERLDRFGRVKSQVWYDGTDVLDQFDYSLDFAGNRTGRDIPAGLTNGFDQLYTYDDLDRLRTYEEGTISMGAIGSPTKDADWTLDALGNWSAYEEKVSSTTTLDQTRTANGANEITDITNTTGSAWTDPTHDAAGNVTLAPSPTAPGNSAKDQTYIWDAWNRLVEVLEGETTLATYEYDGLHRRIKKAVDGTNHHYYLSEQDQILEEQTQSGMGAAEVLNEFVWHPYYVDALAARWDDSGESGLYYHPLHDGNFNVTAVIDGSADVQERYHYTPYGQTTFLDASFANPAAASVIGQENLYSGRQLDPETGLFYYRARYYNPRLGTFGGRDAVENVLDSAEAFHQTLNLYQYVGSNPVEWVDPSGEIRVNIVGAHTAAGDYISWLLYGGDTYMVGTKRDSAGNITVDPVLKMTEILEKYKSCISELNLSGHGKGAGIATEHNWKSGIDEEMDPALAKRAATKLCINSIVNICSCSAASDPARLQRMANKLQTKVCACTDTVYVRCTCKGTWTCLTANSEDDDVLKARQKDQVPKKGMGGK